MRPFTACAIVAVIIASGVSAAYAVASLENNPGRCQPLPDGMTVAGYQAKLEQENPGKYAWIQRTQATRFIWEGAGTVHCPAGHYAAVFFSDTTKN